MKQWRKEARKHNDEATATALKHGDIQPGQRVTHQGRKFKESTITRQWAQGAMYPLLAALFGRVGLVNKQMPQV